jgi:tetratricopeptide (TPR) repeat protein
MLSTPEQDFELAKLHINKGELNDAFIILKKLNKKFPTEPIFLNFIGEIHLRKKDFLNGIKFLERSLKLNSSQPKILINIAIAFIELGQFGHALKNLLKSKALDKNNAELYNSLGLVYKKLEDYDNSILSYKHSIELNPINALAYLNLGLTLQDQKNYSEALSCMLKSYELNKNNWNLLIAISNLYTDLGNYEKAMDFCNDALELNNESADAHCNKGIIFHKLKKYDDAIKSYDESLNYDKNYFRSLFNKSMTLLMQKKFHEGWIMYEYRWKTPSKSNMLFPKNKKKWVGDINKSLLLIGEQGVGDQILFCSLIENFQKQCHNISIRIDSRLIPIFERSFTDIKFLSNKTDYKNIKFDEYLPMASITKFIIKSEADYNKNKFFLRSDKNKTRLIQADIKKHNTNDSKICGISWHSSNKDFEKQKSIELDQLISSLNKENFIFINLQYGDFRKDIQNVIQKHNIKFLEFDEIDKFNDLDSLCSLIDCCDHIITVSNVTVHLACSIGKDVRLILGNDSPALWWFGDDSKNYWYPSCKIYRQKNSFESLMNNIKVDLKDT